MRTWRGLVVLAVCSILIACAQVQSSAGGSSASSDGIRDYRSLVAHLRESGVRAEAAGEVEQPFFTPKAKVVRLGQAGEAQVYEYASEEQAAAEAARVNADGSIGTSMPMWIAPPHFFRRRSLIVLYLGSDEQMLLTLRGLLGEQFGGAR